MGGRRRGPVAGHTHFGGCLYKTLPSGQAVRVISERHQAMLEFERTFWTYDEPKESVVRARFQCSADDYYAELNELLEQPASLSRAA